MSVHKAKDFLVQVATDEQAAKKARSAHEGALMNVAAEMGYSFALSDLQEAMADVADLDELSASELQGLAGGRAMLSGGIGGKGRFRTLDS
jgi:predicted ribosomally synthesized peptide with nif11-like leader